MEFRIPSRKAFISTVEVNLTGTIASSGLRGFTGSTGPQGEASIIPGPTGPQGQASTVTGPTGPVGIDALSIVGVPIDFNNAEPGDSLWYTGSTWSNEVRTTDGGNF